MYHYWKLTAIKKKMGEEGGKYAPQFSNAYTSGTECPIDLKPGCKFELVCCLKVYEKKLTNFS